MLSMSVFYSLLADLLIAAQAEYLDQAGVNTAPHAILRVDGVMKGQAHWNNGYS